MGGLDEGVLGAGGFRPGDQGQGQRSEGEVETQGLVERSDVVARQGADPSADPLDGDGSDLLGLRLGVAGEAARLSAKEHLEGVDA